jgi:hypothetical protein
LTERSAPFSPFVQHRAMPQLAASLLLGLALAGSVLGRTHAAEDDDPSAEAIGLAMRQEGVVTGAPYCATFVRETVAWEADGRRSVQRQRMPICRDGEGRTRREVQVDGGPRRVYLNDPVARTAWVLDPSRKLARTLVLAPTRQAQPASPARPGPGLSERQRALAQHAEWDWPASAGAGDPHAGFRRGDGVVTPLPGRTLEGLSLTGERTTWDLPAAAGRATSAAAVIVREVWRSPALQVTVRLHDRDPRHGDVTERLEQIRLGEPDPGLMRVPADHQRQTPGRPAAPAAMVKPSG